MSFLHIFLNEQSAPTHSFMENTKKQVKFTEQNTTSGNLTGNTAGALTDSEIFGSSSSPIVTGRDPVLSITNDRQSPSTVTTISTSEYEEEDSLSDEEDLDSELSRDSESVDKHDKDDNSRDSASDSGSDSNTTATTSPSLSRTTSSASSGSDSSRSQEPSPSTAADRTVSSATYPSRRPLFVAKRNNKVLTNRTTTRPTTTTKTTKRPFYLPRNKKKLPRLLLD